MFLPERYVFTGNQYFSSNSNQKTLDSDLICESVKEIQNQLAGVL